MAFNSHPLKQVKEVFSSGNLLSAKHPELYFQVVVKVKTSKHSGLKKKLNDYLSHLSIVTFHRSFKQPHVENADINRYIGRVIDR